jgi:hypothetical protein
MSVLSIDTQTAQHWILKHKSLKQDTKSQNTNKWLERNYHGLPLEYGDVDYKELGNILKSLKFEYLYMKGLQKQKNIEVIPHVTVINLEELECPRLDQLQTNNILPCCIFHKDLNPKKCTFYRVFAIRNGFINNS